MVWHCVFSCNPNNIQCIEAGWDKLEFKSIVSFYKVKVSIGTSGGWRILTWTCNLKWLVYEISWLYSQPVISWWLVSNIKWSTLQEWCKYFFRSLFKTLGIESQVTMVHSQSFSYLLHTAAFMVSSVKPIRKLIKISQSSIHASSQLTDKPKLDLLSYCIA